ncbi:CCR4-NOT transcriptional regulation complex, NOT5 subunit [Ceraceosorus bombacis]|uniref:General negative regulator of transcription subunit n=1 Tax=Ceraceosorus bombacis TaxID=401625 RepID=A0A0P1BJJ0_9BASI|nr:CCR4-NOT transcriptional regulation complex, NOT5 subunit [Ceraceosorus bombacis]
MAARKLAAEIDRTLKKVAEGVQAFEDLYDKMQMSTNQGQKEKMEADLKTQIKKLQRMRDSIKTWLQSNDIKDKKALLDNRKLIELQMEKFKQCEKEMKTKAFSKEGLIAAARLDPAERAKLELTQWLTNNVDELSHQMEAAEAEVEQLAGSGKKKKGAGGVAAERSAELERLNERRTWHISKLELILRLIENGNLDTEQVSNIKEDVAYFVESNADEDFEEDEGIYDEFNLDEQEEAFGLKENEDDESGDDDSASEEAPLPKPAVKPKKEEKEEVVKKPSTRKASDVSRDSKPAVVTKAAPTPASAAAPPHSPVATASMTSPPKPAAAPLPPIRYAAAAAAAVAQSSGGPAPTASLSPTTTASQLPDGSRSPSSSKAALEDAASSPAPSFAPSTDTAPTADGTTASATTGPPGLAARPANGSAKSSPAPRHATVKSAPSPLASTSAAPGAPVEGNSGGTQRNAYTDESAVPQEETSEYQPAQLAASSAAASLVQPSGGGAGTSSEQAAAQREHGTEPRLPNSLSDLVTSFDAAKHKSLERGDNLDELHKTLQASALGVPEPQDSDAPRYYRPQNPWASPSWYPQQPLSIFDNPALYSKVEDDTLFFIFYYSQREYHRYLAANELKRQSWRFSLRFGTWFQRYAQPKVVHDDYEEGSYIYFDFENSWQQRRKQTFRAP